MTDLSKIYRAIGERIQEILDSKNPSTDDLIELEMLYGDQYDILVAMRNSAHFYVPQANWIN